MRQVKKPRQTAIIINNTTEQEQTHPLLQKADHMERFPRISYSLPQKLKKLVQTAALQCTRVLIQPVGLLRHQENRSYVNKEGIIHWSVEIVTYNEGLEGDDTIEKKERRLVGPVAETSRVGDIVPKSISSTSLFYCLRRLPSTTCQPVNLDHTWKEILQAMTVIEFPTLYIGPKTKFSLTIEEVES